MVVFVVGSVAGVVVGFVVEAVAVTSSSDGTR
jgi:hypothetical protein